MTMSMKLTPAERLVKATVILQREHPFFSYILMNFDTKECKPDTRIPTMGISKYGHLYWNEEFVKSLNNVELQYVLCHEVLHIAKGDPFRVGKRDKMIWNIAADCVINDMLNQEGFTAPKNGLIPDRDGKIVFNKKTYKVRGKTTEELYEDLLKDMKVIKMQVSGGKGDGDPMNGHGGFDVHLEEDKDDKGEKTGDEKSSASIKQAEGKWKKTAVEAATVARQRGKMPGGMEDLLEGLREPKIDWRARLRTLVTDEIPVDFENRIPGRRFYGTGVWCPRVLRENVNIFISIDCSGSTMGDRERFASECIGIISGHPQVKARLICWDTNVSPNNDLEVDSQTMDKLKKLNLKNVNGGTEFSAYTRYLEEKGYNSRVHIVLTDGYIESAPKCPNGKCIFVLCAQGSDEIIKKYGEVLYLRDEDPNYHQD